MTWPNTLWLQKKNLEFYRLNGERGVYAVEWVYRVGYTGYEKLYAERLFLFFTVQNICIVFLSHMAVYISQQPCNHLLRSFHLIPYWTCLDQKLWSCSYFNIHPFGAAHLLASNRARPETFVSVSTRRNKNRKICMQRLTRRRECSGRYWGRSKNEKTDFDDRQMRFEAIPTMVPSWMSKQRIEQNLKVCRTMLSAGRCL
jgi:hypothetical protein